MMTWIKGIKKNKKKLAVSFLFLLLAGTLVILAKNNFWFKKEITIGVITDIHAGSQDTRSEGQGANGIPNILHPANFEANLKKALEGMKKSNFIIALGDNVNVYNTNLKYPNILKQMTSSYPMLWVQGNHDTDESFAVLSPQKYYYKDIGKWRVIVLSNGSFIPDPDNHYIDNPRGYMDDHQISWLKEALKTDKKVLIAMHVPIFNGDDINQVQLEQEWLKKLFEDSGNVKYVLAGHYHVYNIHKEINGINYYLVPSLELEGQEGFYEILKLDN